MLGYHRDGIRCYADMLVGHNAHMLEVGDHSRILGGHMGGIVGNSNILGGYRDDVAAHTNMLSSHMGGG